MSEANGHSRNNQKISDCSSEDDFAFNKTKATADSARENIEESHSSDESIAINNKSTTQLKKVTKRLRMSSESSNSSDCDSVDISKNSLKKMKSTSTCSVKRDLASENLKLAKSIEFQPVVKLMQLQAPSGATNVLLPQDCSNECDYNKTCTNLLSTNKESSGSNEEQSFDEYQHKTKENADKEVKADVNCKSSMISRNENSNNNNKISPSKKITLKKSSDSDKSDSPQEQDINLEQKPCEEAESKDSHTKRKSLVSDGVESSDIEPNKENEAKISEKRKALEQFLTSSSDDSDDSDDSSESLHEKKTQKSRFSRDLEKSASERKIPKKDSEKTSIRIERLKKYIRLTGIHIKSYNKVWGNCKTNKAKIEKLLEVLTDAGLKGKPTIKKCKRLQAKREKKEELRSLDVTNIISSEKGRPKRNAHSLYLHSSSKSPEEHTKSTRFSRIQDILDSEESD